MKSKELRIGNFIRYRDEWECEVQSLGYRFATHNKDLTEVLYDIRCGSDDIAEYNPIPLTGEWLLKCGFIREWDEDASWYEHSGFPIIGELCTSSNEEYVFDVDTDTLRIRFVHQLQNLYFTLSGEELVFKDHE